MILMTNWKLLGLASILLFHKCVFQPIQPNTTSSAITFTSEKVQIWLSLSTSSTSLSHPHSTSSVDYRHINNNSTDSSGGKSGTLLLYISISVAVSSVAIVLILAIYFCRSDQKKKRQMNTTERRNIPMVPGTSDQSDQLIESHPVKPPSAERQHWEPPPPVIRDIWEIPKERLHVGIKLGEGAFGFVFKGILTLQDNQTRLVAVKTVKENSPPSDLKDLLSELDIMKKLKPHHNVISLIGVTLNDVSQPYVIVDFVPFGDLLGYLRKSRGIEDTCYTQTDNQPVTSLTSEDLSMFAIDSAKGMQYLSMKKIVHRDLAARNVLVGEGGTCKITDFGMARDIRQNEIYTRTTRGLIPVKWTAIESIIDGTYTTKSDVWSFGVLLFEILTIGGCPYPKMNGYEVRQFIEEGNRIPKPYHVDNELYAVMRECWQSNPTRRPRFKDLVHTLERLKQYHREYINLSQYDPGHYENINALDHNVCL